MACRICDQVFFDNKSLVNHFQSHFHQDGTLNPENGTKFSSSSSQFTHPLSVPVPVNVHNSSANGCVGPCGRNNIPPNPPNLLLMGNNPHPKLLPNSIQLAGPTITRRPQSYPSPSIIRSAISQRPRSNQPSNFHSRFASQPAGPPNSPIGLITPRTIISQPARQSNIHFSVSRATSTTQPIRQSSFCSPLSAFVSQSNPGSSSLARGTTTNSVVPTVRTNEVEGSFSGYTKPYIMQLEQPIGETMFGHNDVGGNVSPDEMDLTLKL